MLCLLYFLHICYFINVSHIRGMRSCKVLLREIIKSTSKDMEESQRHCAEWKKPDLKAYVLYELFICHSKKGKIIELKQASNCQGLGTGRSDCRRVNTKDFFGILELFYILLMALVARACACVVTHRFGHWNFYSNINFKNKKKIKFYYYI